MKQTETLANSDKTKIVQTNNTIWTLPKRWIHDWKKANSKDQVSMIRDVLTIFGIPSLTIMWPYLKKIDSINIVLWTLFIIFSLFSIMVYILLPSTALWLIHKYVRLKPVKIFLSVFIVLLALILLMPYSQFSRRVWEYLIF
ncbi:hypothetical protein [Paenibacillus alvei]|uniref:Uncharacterized protein n=1 Tax=Paenibacillus alvei TaxID=44250 RepID=A0AAP7DJU4_PAEAL|nr:hypothetical protein [Paenibacillus alvei]NOJ73178.1 hypothetical protein [Paenibacillus alvei]